MALPAWIQRFLTASTNKTPSRRQPLHRRSVRPQVELLEDRVVPTAGMLDTTFSGDGMLTTPMGSSNDTATSVVIDGNGRILVVGSSLNPATPTVDNDFALARYNADGSLDTSFGTGGKVVTNFAPATSDSAAGVAIDSNGKIVVGGTSGTQFAVARYNTDGSLDTSFGFQGLATTDIGSDGLAQARAMAIDGNGRIVIAGIAFRSLSTFDIALARFNSNGSLDTSFDGDGKVITPVGSASSSVEGMVIDPNGRIVVAGVCQNGGNSDFALVRYNPNGSLDTSFDADGIVTTDFNGAHDFAHSLAIDGNAKIVVAGHTFNGSNTSFALTRYNTNGALDTTFDGDGRATTLIGPTNDRPTDVVIDGTGKIVVAGYITVGTSPRFAVLRYFANGFLDNSFDSDGIVTTVVGPSEDNALSLVIDSNGKLVVVGRSYNGTNYDFAVARYETSDSPSGTITTDTPTFTWAAFTSFDPYDISVFDAATGQLVLHNGNAVGGTWTPSPSQALTPGRSYTWYARTIGPSGLLGFAAPVNFTIIPLAAPTQLSPIGAVAASNGYDRPTFTWSAVPLANHYYLYVVDNTTGAAIIHNPNVGAGTSFMPSASQVLTPGHTYTWYVAAVSTNGLVMNYLTSGQSFALAALANPVQLGPTGTIDASAGYDRPTFMWKASPGADHYYLHVQDTTTGAVVINDPQVNALAYSPTDFSYTASQSQALSPGHSFVWYIGAVSTNGLAMSYDPVGRTFSLAALPAPTQIGPAGSIPASDGYDRPTYSWNPVAGASTYLVYVVDNTTNSVIINDYTPLSSYPSTPSFALTPGHAFTWYVGAISTNLLINSYDPAGRAFNLTALAMPTQLAPTGSVGPTPQYSWQAVTGADHYYLYVVNTTTGQVVINNPNVGNVTSITPGVTLVSGHRYTWYVAAVSSNNMAIEYVLSGMTFQVL